MKIFTFGDGFATGHIWPEWPQILEALLPDYAVVNTAGIGSGAEFLVTNFVEMIDQFDSQIVIFQWPIAGRFDKLIQDNSWNDVISKDLSYSVNFVADKNLRKWWLSSASIQKQVRAYHDVYCQSEQQKSRLKVYQKLVQHVLQPLNCQYISTSTNDQNNFSRHQRFKNVRQNQVQPSPWIHLCWLLEVILPRLKIVIDQDRVAKLSDLILSQSWIAYHPDRNEIWQTMRQKLDA